MDIIGDRTLRSLLEEKVSIHATKTWIAFEDAGGHQTTKTYAEFYDGVLKLSNALLDLNIQKGDHVTIHLPNNIEFLTTWFALAHIGAIMVPTNILSSADEMSYIINHSESVLLITEEEHVEKFQNIIEDLPTIQHIILTRFKNESPSLLNFDRLIEKASTDTSRFPKVSTEDVVGMLYTSGTTSKPKGVQITNANYIYTGELMSKSIQVTEDDRMFIVLPLFHGNAQYYSTMSALVTGGSIALTEKFSASRYFKQAKSLGGTVGSLFAAPIRMILAKDYTEELRENPIRLVMYAQAIAEHQIKEFEEKFDCKLLHMYGMTETVGIPLINPLNGVRKNLSIGRPSIGYEVKLIDEQGEEVTQGTVGQIAVKGVPGRTIMKQYFKNEEATRQTLQDGWLLTGDNARIGEDGYFYFVDRVKDMIKRSGENVAAQEVESVLTQHLAVYECAVIGVPDDMRDEAIKAFVILNKDMSVTEEELIEFCKERLAKFKVPNSIEFVEDFPRTPVGKIQKHILRSSISI
ncbi:crotonobetaine/carnitine-CoA ligase [Lysinibacillus composti]|uniref:ATP-dependent acyl-CoA ligase n=1 Tax=Lysinibacillus composti TaxID=720633 RepID=A0A3N9UBF8_9BACI|nr:AMP-binding protein [Lysinibacillus composti]MBM7610268.1 crotonobetaine/carnitine-CoA ligase [Lysinibacillus composti]RQW73813.1 ATP-dependent acyl-CoA ligase [Lysinibacillus composti]